MDAINQGLAVIASEDDLVKDAIGYTNPNLHRRVATSPGGVGSRNYKLSICGTESYRTVETVTHDEESITSEIP